MNYLVVSARSISDFSIKLFDNFYQAKSYADNITADGYNVSVSVETTTLYTDIDGEVKYAAYNKEGLRDILKQISNGIVFDNCKTLADEYSAYLDACFEYVTKRKPRWFDVLMHTIQEVM